MAWAVWALVLRSLADAAPYTAKDVQCGSSITCVLLEDSLLKCLGNGFFLGQGDMLWRGDDADELGDMLPTVDLGAGRTVQQVAQHGVMTCAVLDNGSLKCWGHAEYWGAPLGQPEAVLAAMGNGNTYVGEAADEMGEYLPSVELGSGRTVTQVAVGEHFACALLDTEAVKCWGHAGSGRLGYGDTTDRGRTAGTMGDALPEVDLGPGRTVKQVACGARHACAVLDDDSLKCWGQGGNGRLGQGDTSDRGDESEEMGAKLPPIDLGTGRTAKLVAAGESHTCALLDDGTVKCWGWGILGALGSGAMDDLGDGASEMGDHLPAVGLGTGRSAKQLGVGSGHNCAVLDNDEVKCWGGQGLTGSLGYGHEMAVGYSAGQMGDALPAVSLGSGKTAKKIAAGTSASCAVLSDGSVKCWGSNVYGSLGLGDTDDRGNEVGEMGDSLPSIDLGTMPTTTTFLGACAR